MAKNHLKRLSAPKAWPLKRRGITFTARPDAGAHQFALGMPLVVVLRDMLKVCMTSREARILIREGKVMVDGRKPGDHRFITGFMDIITFPTLKTHYRVVIDAQGKLSLISIDAKEAMLKPCKLTGKRLVRGKMHIHTFDGRTLAVEKDNYKVGDTVLLEMPSQSIKDAFRLEKGSAVYLIAGKHSGDIGVIESSQTGKFIFKSRSGSTFETLKEYAFVIGKDKPCIKLP